MGSQVTTTTQQSKATPMEEALNQQQYDLNQFMQGASIRGYNNWQRYVEIEEILDDSVEDENEEE